MNSPFAFLVLRIILNGFSLWIAARLLKGNGIEYDESQSFVLFLTAGIVLSAVNVLLKPLVVLLSLPAILLTLGLFTLIVNGLMIYLAGLIVPNLYIGFWAAVLAGIIVSLINYVLTNLLDSNNLRNQTNGR